MDLLYGKYDLPFLATLAEAPEPFADALQEAQAGLGREQQLWDVMAMYCRDETAYPDRLPLNFKWNDSPFLPENPDRLFPVPFPEATLGRWLTAVGDETVRAYRVARSLVYESVQDNICGWRSLLLPLEELPMNSDLHRTELAARLDLKRRVARMFGEISFGLKCKAGGKWGPSESFPAAMTFSGADTTLHLRPVDLLPMPPQEISASWDGAVGDIRENLRQIRERAEREAGWDYSIPPRYIDTV